MAVTGRSFTGGYRKHEATGLILSAGDSSRWPDKRGRPARASRGGGHLLLPLADGALKWLKIRGKTAGWKSLEQNHAGPSDKKHSFGAQLGRVV